MSTEGKIAAVMSRGRTAAADTAASHGIQVQSLSASVLPAAPIRYVYYIFLFALPFEERIGGLSLLGLLLVSLTALQPRLFFQLPPRAFWCFVIYFLVVAGFGFSIVMEGQQIAQFRSELVTQLFRLFQLLVLFLISYRLMTFEAIAQRGLLIFSLSCLLLAALQVSGVVGTATADPARMTAYDFNPNVVALLLSVGLISIVGLAYGRKNADWKLRLLTWVSTPFLLFAVAGTGSRGSMLAAIVALMILIVNPARLLQRIKTVAIVAAAILSLVGVAYQIEVVRDRWESTYYTGEVAGRDVLMPVAWEMFLERPIIGWGPVNHYYEMNARTRDPEGGDPHNLYLWILKETGLVGAAPFILGLWLAWRSAWKARGSSHGSLPLALLLLVLANNLKGTYLFFKILWIVLAYVLASGTYIIAGSKTTRQSENSHSRPRLAPASVARL